MMLYSETLITIVIPTSRGKTVLAMLLVVLDEEGVSIFHCAISSVGE